MSKYAIKVSFYSKNVKSVCQRGLRWGTKGGSVTIAVARQPHVRCFPIGQPITWTSTTAQILISFFPYLNADTITDVPHFPHLCPLPPNSATPHLHRSVVCVHELHMYVLWANLFQSPAPPPFRDLSVCSMYHVSGFISISK